MGTPKAQTIQQNEMREWLESEAKNICKKIVNFSEDWSEAELSKIKEKWNNEISEQTERLIRLYDVKVKETKETENVIFEDFPLSSPVLPEVWSKFVKARNKAKECNDVLGKLSKVDPPSFPEKEFHINWMWYSLEWHSGHAFMLATVYPSRHMAINTPLSNNIPIIEGRIGEIKIVFMVKTTMPYFGELLQEIQAHKNKYKDYLFYIVARDDRYVDLFNSEGIGFVKHPTGEVFQTDADKKRGQEGK